MTLAREDGAVYFESWMGLLRVVLIGVLALVCGNGFSVAVAA